MIEVRQNLHTHTNFCDGKNTAEEMVLSAVEKGMTSIGFSGHALTPHDTSYCMSAENTIRYRDELLRLKDKYSGVISIYIGLEQDYYSVSPLIKTEYLIGSVHYVYKNGEHIPVDESRSIVESAVDRLYGGDIYSFLEDYYKTAANIYSRTKCDIVGHLDLPEKFNADDTLFDRNNSRYVLAYEYAVKELISNNCIFEINTGAMSRGYTKQPYPHSNILRKIAQLGGKITVSSDSHDVSTIDYSLTEMLTLSKECGLTEMYQFGKNGFYSVDI